VDYSTLHDLDIPPVLPGDHVAEREGDMEWYYPDGALMPERWSQLFRPDEIGRLKQRHHLSADLWINDRPVLVSTVWLGLNHQFRQGPPLIFETMIFADLDWMDQFCRRYATWAAAMNGHTLIVAALTEGGATLVAPSGTRLQPPSS
jgi:hypothetical protein